MLQVYIIDFIFTLRRALVFIHPEEIQKGKIGTGPSERDLGPGRAAEGPGTRYDPLPCMSWGGWCVCVCV